MIGVVRPAAIDPEKAVGDEIVGHDAPVRGKKGGNVAGDQHVPDGLTIGIGREGVEKGVSHRKNLHP